MGRTAEEILTGTKFGEWTVLANGKSSSPARRFMLCRCSCGLEKEVALGGLKNGKSTRCFTCSRRLTPRGGKPKIQVKPGDVYGAWTVLEEVETQDGIRRIRCRCSCDVEKELPLYAVYAGKTKSCAACGLAKSKLPRKVVSMSMAEEKREEPRKLRALVAVLPGTRFGFWEVIKEVERIPPAPRRVLCRCTCGTEAENRLSDLKLGRTTQCGCQTRRGPKPEIRVSIGDVFGKWTVKEKASSWGDALLCRCACGRERQVFRANLVTGKSTQCLPCSKGKPAPTENETSARAAPRTGREVVVHVEVGAIYGNWTVITEETDLNDKDKDERYFRCRCSCGTEKSVQMRNLTRGRSRSCHSCARRLFSGMKSEITGNELLHTKWAVVRRHAEERGLAVEITPEQAWLVFLAQNEKCALTGLSLTLGVRDSSSNASLDRIDNNRGYVTGNIQWVKADINQMKNKHDQAYFIELCELVVKYKRK